MKQASAAQLQISGTIRVLAAVLVAGGVTAVAVVFTWGPLDVRSDVIGYSTFYDFNYENYFTAYYLVVGFFPIAALLLFLGLTRIGPRIGLPVPPPRGSLRAAAPPPEVPPALVGEPPLSEAPLTKRRAVAAARIAFVGVILGLEAGIAGDAIWRGLVLGLVIYAFAAILATAVLDRRGSGDWSFEQRLAAVNSFGASLSVAGLIAVSASTEVRIVADGSVRHYPWFPLWLGAPAAAALAGWLAIALRRSSPAGVTGIERRALVLIAAPVCLFILLAGLRGDLGHVDFFHVGEPLVGSRLVGDGWLPWRDLVLAHGLLTDVAGPGLSLAIFGESYWGFIAGEGLLLTPLFFVSLYFLFVYLFGRNWLFLLFMALLMLGSLLVPSHFRFLLWPLILILLAVVLDDPTRPRIVGLAFASVGQVIVTPEAAPALLAVTVVLVAFEIYDREPGQGFIASFPRTIWFAASGLVFAALFVAYLASRGALGDFLFLNASLLQGHALAGARPPTNHAGMSDARYLFMALGPIAVMLIAFAYCVVRLRLRLRPHTADWMMGAAALCTLLYYPKFLSSMDSGHLTQTYAVALPLMLFVLYRAVEAAENAIRNAGPGRRLARFVAHPVSLALVLLVAVFGWGRLGDRVSEVSAAYRPAAAAKPTLKRLGYGAAFDPTIYRDLKQVIDANLIPHDRVFDFTNSPGLFHYLIDRYPSTRHFNMTLAYNAELQEDVIDRLRRARPKLIVFDTFIVGLPNWDGIPTMVRQYEISRWILDHYRPLLTTHSTTIYARHDIPPPSKAQLSLSEEPIIRDPEFLTQTCNWRYAPNFLSGIAEPVPGSPSVPARVGTPRRRIVTVYGWAGDARAQAPARKVIATLDGTVVGRTKPGVRRPELGAVPGFTRSGFNLAIPVANMRRAGASGHLKVYAVARDGAIGQLGRVGEQPRGGIAQLGRRNVQQLDPTAIQGSIDRVRRAAAIQIAAPPGSRWSDYRWLEFDAGERGFRRGVYWLYDHVAIADPRREISFRTLDDSSRSYRIPVASCAQWHGYGNRPLRLSMSPHQGIAGIRLLR